ncbi:hypothetical protein L0668_11455 [Paraglaciecola aquimarina]|uniref:Uncharacterized protein n=1 Tax=Paraglaciecola algarum TaxID=3050085 RepID=A0ABS9D773_9ALTE|nr:hypothetical protein [Paraglaciecola sp. G1-23]MCF2948726.1 hypothetical protein [Paraglaciecola sp. G1-23]
MKQIQGELIALGNLGLTIWGADIKLYIHLTVPRHAGYSEIRGHQDYPASGTTFIR